MRISRDKLNKLAHMVADTLAETRRVRLPRRPQHHPAGGAQGAREAAAGGDGIDAAARQKIASQRKIILEGSQEWDILYRKYYNEEVKKLGL